MNVLELYNIADSNDIDVYHYSLHPLKSISMPSVIGIDIDQIKTTVEEKTVLAHELGHCMKGAFYNIHSKYDIKARHEQKADKWAIKTLIPLDSLQDALKNGVSTRWELSHYFGVPETFIEKTLSLYENELMLFNAGTEW